MHVHRSTEGLVVQAPAKLNLFFEVLAKRPDGYHEIETLVYPIDLYDTLVFREDSSEQVELGCDQGSGTWVSRGLGLTDLPTGRQNLVVRAVESLRERAGLDRGLTVRLIKRIPSAAGLGGGSSDAAAALAAANVAWNLGWSPTQLAELGAELGSDVPLFFAQGPAVCRGRGERVEAAPGLAALNFVVVRPPDGLSTAAVYQTCRVPGAPESVVALVKALTEGRLAAAGQRFFNRLQPAAERLSPWIARLRDEFARMDCLGHQMSGSGTCYFGLFRSLRHARRAARCLAARAVGQAYAVRGSR